MSSRDTSELKRQFTSLHATLSQRRGDDDEPTDGLRRRTAQALDACSQAGIPLRADEVDLRLLRPPWSTRRAESAAAADGGAEGVGESRRALISRLPTAEALLHWLDARSIAFEPYRRLSERHLPWTDASVAATVAAVQQARARSPSLRPRVLVAQGSLGAEAAAAAAAGASVVALEPNRFAADAIRDVAWKHGVGHAVRVVERSLEDYLEEEASAEVVVLTPLLEEAALGRRLLPAAAAVRAAAQRAARAPPPILVPASVEVRAALGLLSAAVVHGVDLTPLDVT